MLRSIFRTSHDCNFARSDQDKRLMTAALMLLTGNVAIAGVLFIGFGASQFAR